MEGGKLPDFDQSGNMILPETEENATSGATSAAADGQEATAFARYMEDAMFLIPTPQVLQKIITGLEELYTQELADRDMQGDVYEYMLNKLSQSGQNGQFRTPQHIFKMIVDLVAPTP